MIWKCFDDPQNEVLNIWDSDEVPIPTPNFGMSSKKRFEIAFFLLPQIIHLEWECISFHWVQFAS